MKIPALQDINLTLPDQFYVFAKLQTLLVIGKNGRNITSAKTETFK